ncbi:hypothetical protein QP189_12670, partial [Staphylococcus lugdunensis]|nr:hypothetical protein [Staphylococcus lugdunensis]
GHYRRADHSHRRQHQLAAVFTNARVIERIGGHATCPEAETIAARLRLEHSDESVEAWLGAHAARDDDSTTSTATGPPPRPCRA